MRWVAAIVAAAVATGLAVAPPDAEGKRPKRARAAVKRKAPAVTHRWRALPKVVAPAPVAPRPLDVPAQPLQAPVTPAGVPAAPPPPAAEPPKPPACDPSPWLGVTAEDVSGFRFRLTRTCVPAGTVLLQFRNNDLSDHNLWAEGVAPAAAKREVVGRTAGETIVEASAQLTAGRWRLFCSFPGHEAMSRLVDVTPAG